MAKREVKPTSERYVQRQVILYLRKFGWHAVNTSGSWRSARGMAGFPDVIAFRRGVTILVECKSTTGKLRPAQEKFFERFKSHQGQYLRHCLVFAGEFEVFLSSLEGTYFVNGWEWTKTMNEWRPKHDHLI